MNTSSSDGRFLCNDAIHPSALSPAVREAALPSSFYNHCTYDDESLSSATSTTRGRRRFRRVRAPRTSSNGGAHESTKPGGAQRRNERVAAPTGIAEVAIRIKDQAACHNSPNVPMRDQVQDTCDAHSDESSISSISSYGEDVPAATDSTVDDPSCKDERNTV